VFNFDEIMEYDDSYYFVNDFDVKIVDNKMFVQHNKTEFSHSSRCQLDCLVYTEMEDHDLSKVLLFVTCKLTKSDLTWLEGLNEELRPLRCEVILSDL